jgi:hypothetical protein
VEFMTCCLVRRAQVEDGTTSEHSKCSWSRASDQVLKARGWFHWRKVVADFPRIQEMLTFFESEDVVVILKRVKSNRREHKSQYTSYLIARRTCVGMSLRVVVELSTLSNDQA